MNTLTLTLYSSFNRLMESGPFVLSKVLLKAEVHQEVSPVWVDWLDKVNNWAQIGLELGRTV